MKQMTLINSFLCLCSILMLVCPFASAEKIEQRGIELNYDYQSINDGFGNIKSIEVKGIVRNTTSQDAAKIRIQFRLAWQNRGPKTQKLDIDNLAAQSDQEFQFVVDLGQNPSVLESITAKFNSIKLETTRKISPPSVHNVQSRDLFSLTKLTVEGKQFDDKIEELKKKTPFVTPVKDEFETTEEFDTRLNQIENQHFIKLMDLLEKQYGEHVGGKGAVIRFLPKSIDGQLYYVSETSGYFLLPIRLGPYDADHGLFNDVNFNPRTVVFKPVSIHPLADLQLTHKDSLFFLRKPEFRVAREEGRVLRESEKYLALEVSFRFAVIQDGSDFHSRAIVEQLQLIDTQTGKVHRTWNLDVK